MREIRAILYYRLEKGQNREQRVAYPAPFASSIANTAEDEATSEFNVSD